MTELLTMQVRRPAIHESARVVAFHIRDGHKWELAKRSDGHLWRILRDGDLWVETTHAGRAHEIFNDILERRG